MVNKIMTPDYSIGRVIEKFRDYQIEWLTSHCDIEFVPEEEQLIVRFLKDTAECFLKGKEWR